MDRMRIPLWKLKREARRLGQKLAGLPGSIHEDIFKRNRYDTYHVHEARVTDGHLPEGAETAIYLIFPADGLMPSHLSALQQMIDEGIAPLVISNLPLTDADRDTLTRYAWRIMERPNIGYDFGGYRDGVLHLADRLASLDRLFIVNDSVWIVDAPQNWFREVRALDVDFGAATSNYGIKRIDAEKFRDLTWNYTIDHRNHHYASYALAIGPRILRDPAFLEFWTRFKLSDNKKKIVRRGEIGLTQMIQKRGYSHAATCPVFGLDKEIEALTDTELDTLAHDIVLPEDHRLRRVRRRVLKSDPLTQDGRRDRIQLVLTAVARQAIGYALPTFTIPRRGFQFVKKSPLWLSLEGSDTMLAFLDTLDGPLGRQAAKEAKALRASKGKDLEKQPEP